jgi:Ca-activated chloride channel homolog
LGVVCLFTLSFGLAPSNDLASEDTVKWENPQLLYWIAFVPLLWFFAWLSQKQSWKKLQKHFGGTLQELWKSNLSLISRYWKWALRVFVLAFLLLALARPQVGQSQEAIRSEGFEIFLAVDVSNSMMAEDLRPSRLEKAKIDLNRLVDNLSGHKIGVIAFAGSAVVISPLTQDLSAVKMYIDSLDSQTVSTQGTNFEAAIMAAEEAFERGGAGEGATVTRVIILASDGEDQEPGALQKVGELFKKGIRVFAIAYGTEKGAPIPERDRMNFLKGYKKDRSGQTILTTVKGEALKAMAEKSQGFFTFATLDSSFIQELVKHLDTLEKKEFESEFQVQYDEKFQIFLFLAFLLGLIELLLTDAKRRKA